MNEITRNKEIYEALWSSDITDYKSYSAGNLWYNRRIMKLIKKYVKIDTIKSLADIGCGDGSKTYLLSTIFKNASVVGFDLTEAAIYHAKNLYKRDNLRFEMAEASGVSGEYDIVSYLEVLEHIEDWKGTVKKMIFAPSKNSPKYLIISAPVGRMRKDELMDGHVRNFKKGEIEEFMTHMGYKTLIGSYGGFPFYSPLMRNFKELTRKHYEKTLGHKMSIFSKITHKLVSFLLCYCCFQNLKGDAFIGIFERSEHDDNEKNYK